MNGNSSYRLFASQRSPFARRIRLAFRRLKLEAKEEFVDVFGDARELNAANPAGMVPTLETADAGPLSDSGNILEYLHEKTGFIWPAESMARIRVRQNSALAVGMIQASVLYYQELYMHELPSQKWVHDHASVVQNSIAFIAKTLPDGWLQNAKLTQAGWDLCVALEYVSLRLPWVQWESNYPQLAELLAVAKQDAFFVESAPKL